MRSYLRAVRAALRYRWLLAASVMCSMAIGVLWGANIGALYPFMEVLFSGKSLQESVAESIEEGQTRCKRLAASIDETQRELGEATVSDQQDLRAELTKLRNELSAQQKAVETNQAYQPYVDRYFPHDPFKTVILVILVIIAGTILRSLFLVANTFLTARAVQLTMVDLQNQLFDHTLRQDLAVVQRQASSGFVTQHVNVMQLIAASLQAFFGAAVREPLKLLACLIGAAFISWRLLLLSLICAPIGIFLLYLLTRVLKTATKSSINLMGERIRRVTEMYGGFVTVKAFSLESRERARFRRNAEELAWMRQKLSTLLVLSKPITEIMAVGITAIALLAGTYLVTTGATHIFGVRMADRPLEPAQLMVFFAMLAGVADPARKLSGIFGNIYMGVVGCNGVFRALDRVPKIAQSADAKPFDGLKRRIVFRNVSFWYQPGTPVLQSVSLDINAGETIALVGPNGCGKSTLAKLLLRLYDTRRGSIVFDGSRLKDLRIRDLRRNTGLLTQETWLFDEDIMYNIRCGNLNATDAEVMEAARKAHAHEFIVNTLPDGYQTKVGEAGKSLSGGQRQRIALARVILRDPSLLVLDEATSEIDLESEALIHQSLRQFMVGRTTIMITHRMSSLALADRIVVFDHGRILDIGTDEELRDRCEVYQKLLDTQSRKAA
jgi:subfamily B ATP-binding cassette protein MsbA